MSDKPSATYYQPLSHVCSDAPMPEEDPEIGPWYCVESRRRQSEGEDLSEHAEFVEVHQSFRGDGIVIRNSEFSTHVRWGGVITLGKCSILNKKQAIQVRDRLTALINALEESPTK